MTKLRLERIDLFRSQVNASQLSHILNVKFRGTHDWMISTTKNRDRQIVSSVAPDPPGPQSPRDSVAGGSGFRNGWAPTSVAATVRRKLNASQRKGGEREESSQPDRLVQSPLQGSRVPAQFWRDRGNPKAQSCRTLATA